MFEEFLDRNSHLSVVNSLNICEGAITRRRKFEESILDFFIVPTSFTKRLVVLICRIVFLTDVASPRVCAPPKM